MRKGVRIEAAPVRAEAILESAETAELRIRFQRRAAKRTISLTSSSDDQSGSSERRRKGSLTGAARLVLARSRPIEWRRSRRTPTRRSSLQRAECGACARSTCPPLPPQTIVGAATLFVPAPFFSHLTTSNPSPKSRRQHSGCRCWLSAILGRLLTVRNFRSSCKAGNKALPISQRRALLSSQSPQAALLAVLAADFST
eukprot:6198799-Pleurochrysis_carterae.AAC.1